MTDARLARESAEVLIETVGAARLSRLSVEALIDHRPVGQVTETQVAQSITTRKTVTVNQVTETDTAQTVIQGGGGNAVDQATETDTAQAITARKTVAVGQTSETDTAQTVTRGGQVVTVNQATETGTAQPVTWAPKIRIVGQATETDTAQTVTRFQDAYSSAVIADSPLLYWRLGEASGTTAADTSGNGRTGTYAGSPALGEVAPMNGNTAVDFDGVDDHVARSDSTITSLTAAWSIELWAKRQTTVAAEHTLAAPKRVGAGESVPWKLSMNSSHQFRVGFFRGSGSGQGWYESDAVVAAVGPWYHVVGTFDGSAMRLYVNGKLVTSYTGLSGTPPIAGAYPDFYLARSWDSATYTDAVLDEFAVYNTALSAARIQAHYLAGLTVQQAVETDTARQVHTPILVGQATETDTALGVDRPGFASETDTAQAVTVRKSQTLGQATETDTAQTVTGRKQITIGQATETDQAFSRVSFTTWIDDQYDYARDRDGLDAVLTVDPPTVPPPDDLAALASPSTPTLTAISGAGLAAGTYSYRVAAYRHDVSQITLPSPAANITISTPNLRVQVEWSPVANASGYVVFAAPGASPSNDDYQEVGRT